MINPVTCFADSTGTIHKTKDEAYRAEIAMMLGRKPGSTESMITDGLISLIWDNREALRNLLFEVDARAVPEE